MALRNILSSFFTVASIQIGKSATQINFNRDTDLSAFSAHVLQGTGSPKPRPSIWIPGTTAVTLGRPTWVLGLQLPKGRLRDMAEVTCWNVTPWACPSPGNLLVTGSHVVRDQSCSCSWQPVAGVPCMLLGRFTAKVMLQGRWYRGA